MTAALTLPEGLTMTRSCAADLTRQINTASENLAGMLKRAHDEKAWQALGYPDWKSYVGAEIKFSGRRVFQLIDFEEIREQVNQVNQVNNCSLPPITHESVTRELKNADPSDRPAIYAKAVETAGGNQPTAKQVKAAASEIPPEPKRERLPKYVPAVAMDIANNAIRMLETIHPTDSTREPALKMVVTYCETQLS